MQDRDKTLVACDFYQNSTVSQSQKVINGICLGMFFFVTERNFVRVGIRVIS
jgi:hypothetical protein